MSYTLTLDIPDTTASYVMGQSPRFHEELQALFVAFVATKMKFDIERESGEKKRRADLSSFFGKAKLEGDAVEFQRQLRDEW